jgi:hypothetical protein
MDITGANATLTMTIPGLFPAPVQLSGFAADDIYELENIDPVEVLMGADGQLSGGFTFKPQQQSITLQADSPSNAFFDSWNQNQVAGVRVYVANGVIVIPSIGLKFVQTKGFLTSYKLPGAKKLVGPRRFMVTWQSVVPAPASA